MAWRRIGDKPLSEPMLTRFTDAYVRGTRGGGGIATQCHIFIIQTENVDTVHGLRSK